MVFKGCGYVLSIQGCGYVMGIYWVWLLYGYLRDVVMLWVFKGLGYAMGI